MRILLYEAPMKKIYVLMDLVTNEYEAFSSKDKLHTRLGNLFGDAVYSYSYFSGILNERNSEVLLEEVIKLEKRAQLDMPRLKISLKKVNAISLNRISGLSKIRKIKIMIVDPYMLLGQALEVLLNQANDLLVVENVYEGKKALRLLRKDEKNTDIVLANDNLSGIDGIRFCEEIKEINPGIKIIFLTDTYGKELIAKAIEAGVDGYLGRDEQTGARDLIQAIRQVYRGEFFFSKKVMDIYIAYQTGRHRESLVSLSKREVEVLELLAEGNSTSEIGIELQIADSTVETYRGNLIRKFEARNIAHVISLAMRVGTLK